MAACHGADLSVQSAVAGAVVDDASKDSSGRAEEQEEASPRLMLLISLMAAVEGADLVLLPCVFAALQLDIDLALSDLAQMSLVQSLFAAGAAPLWGLLADSGTVQRKTIFVTSTVLQGLVTCLLAGIDSMPAILLLRSVNGVLLAALRPVSVGLIADVTSEARRGRVFGWMLMALQIGMVLATLVSTPLARQTVAGVQGWRVAFTGVGAASVLVGLLVMQLMVEPARSPTRAAEKQGLCSELKKVAACFRMPTLVALLLEGTFAMITVHSYSYKTLFFQVSGVSDAEASILNAVGLLSSACGAVLGGLLSDYVVRHHFPVHGRPLLAQLSCILGVPIACLTFMGRPSEEYAFWFYMVLALTGGLTSWCITAVNLPIISEVAPAGSRSGVLAWSMSVQSAVGAVLGNSMVSLLAEGVYGYDLSSAGHSEIKSEENQEALGCAMAFASCVPVAACFFIYALVHWSYPRDKRAADASGDMKMVSMQSNPAIDIDVRTPVADD